MSRRVRIGTCAGAADAAFVRSVFAAHGIDVVVGAETTNIPGLTGGFLSPDIWVDEDDAEEAAALLRDIRESEPASGPGEDEDEDDAGTEDDAAAAPEGDGRPADRAGAPDRREAEPPRAVVAPAPADSVQMRVDRRRRTAVALLLGCCITFGTAHMFTRAWLRGIALAGVESLGFRYLYARSALGGWIVVAAIAYDIAGALWRIRTAPRTTLPVARLRER